MPLKVVELPFDVIASVLERAEIPAAVTEATLGGDSPVSRPQQLLLPPGIIGALKKAQGGELINRDRKTVTLPPGECN
jgi:hypothetical protein